MWITATRAVELYDACEKAVPELEKILGKPLEETGIMVNKVSEVIKKVHDPIEPFRQSLPEGWASPGVTTDWNARSDTLARQVVHLYLVMNERVNQNGKPT